MFNLFNPPFLAIFARPSENFEVLTKIIKKTVIFLGILTGCIDESIIKVNVGGFSM